MIMMPYEPNYFMFFPRIPANCELPPTIFQVLQAIVNFNKREKTPINELAKEGRDKIFNFDYNLTNKISKEEFEVTILNHYMMRRINFDTVSAFSLMLSVKLTEILPLINKMFDAIDNWEIFNDGETTTRIGTDNRTTQNTNQTSNTLTNHSTTTNTDTSDKRYSDTPQNQLDEVRNGNYVTEYSYDTNNNSAEDNSTSNGTSNSTNNMQDNNTYNETIKRSPADKISILKELEENISNVYTILFQKLDILFYGIEQ